MKKLKRLFSVLLTFALVMSFSVSVFAAEKAPDSALTVNEYKEFWRRNLRRICRNLKHLVQMSRKNLLTTCLILQPTAEI